MAQAQLRCYLSSEHFSVDGTLLVRGVARASFKPGADDTGTGTGTGDGDGPKGRNAEADWKGKKRSNDTHASITDPEARLYRKSMNTVMTLCFLGHLLMENRHALIIDAELGTADGYAERSTALEMLGRLPKTQRRRTVGADKAYDTRGFVTDARALGFTPHVAQNTTNRRSAIDGRTTRHPGHKISQSTRPRIEEPFGWIKTVGGGRKLRYKGRDRNRAWFKMTTAVYNVIRIAALDTAATPEPPPARPAWRSPTETGQREDHQPGHQMTASSYPNAPSAPLATPTPTPQRFSAPCCN